MATNGKNDVSFVCWMGLNVGVGCGELKNVFDSLIQGGESGLWLNSSSSDERADDSNSNETRGKPIIVVCYWKICCCCRNKIMTASS